MPFNRPTLTDLIERDRADIDARLPGADSRLRRSTLDVLARMHGGALHGAYGYIDWVSRQIFPDTAEAEELARWAVIWGVTRKAASLASGPVALTGTNGTVVPAATPLIRSDAVEYRTIAEVVIAAGVATVAVEAVEEGISGNLDAAGRLTFVSPVAGVQALGLVGAGGIGGGTDEEDDDSLRARLLDRVRRPPQGGSKSDYERWALEVPGVTRAWVYPGELGPGTVTVRFVIDGRPAIIPTVGEVAVVAAHIDPLRPVTAAVTIVAPIAIPLNFRIKAAPPTVAVQAAIMAELDDLLRREGEPGGTILISHIREAISIAAGELDHEVLAPGGNVIFLTGQIAVPGVITWVA